MVDIRGERGSQFGSPIVCALVCCISPVIAHVHLLIEMHDVLYILDTSVENPRSVVIQRGF
jgi:hypothetical protein